MRNVAALLYGLVPLWCGRLVFPVAPVGDFAATHAVWVSPRNRQEVTIKRWRAEPPTMREMLKLSRTHERVRPESGKWAHFAPKVPSCLEVSNRMANENRSNRFLPANHRF